MWEYLIGRKNLKWVRLPVEEKEKLLKSVFRIEAKDFAKDYEFGSANPIYLLKKEYFFNCDFKIYGRQKQQRSIFWHTNYLFRPGAKPRRSALMPISISTPAPTPSPALSLYASCKITLQLKQRPAL